MTTASKSDFPPHKDYKTTGLQWIEQVPRHWEVRSLSQLGTLGKGMGGTKEDERSEGLPCVRYGDLYTTHKYFIERTRSFIDQEEIEKYTRIEPGDVLFAASGETIEEIGKSAVNLIKGPAYCGWRASSSGRLRGLSSEGRDRLQRWDHEMHTRCDRPETAPGPSRSGYG